MARFDWEKGVHSSTLVGENVVGLHDGLCSFYSILLDSIKNGLGTWIAN